MPLTNTIKSTLRRAFAAVGYRIRTVPTDRLNPVDLRDRTNHPSALLYYGNLTSPSVLIDAPTTHGYSLESFDLRVDGNHPFIRAIRHAHTTDGSERAIRTVLGEYYRRVQPADATEWLGIDPQAAPFLADQPPWARIFPWEDDSLRKRRHSVQSKAVAENRRQGRPLTIDDGWKLCGPVSSRFLHLQAQRLHRLYRSMRDEGYRRHDEVGGDIRAKVLVADNGRWRWLQCGGGFHRTAVACALGYRILPVRVWRVIFRRDVDQWPQVTAGTFTRRGALQVFDRIVDGDSPAVCRGWWRHNP